MNQAASPDRIHESQPQKAATRDSNQTASARPALGLVFPTIVLILFWIVTEGSFRVETAMFFRFVTRMITLLVTLLFFLGWGLSRRHFTWGQRFLALAMIVGSMFVAGFLGHPATGMFATAMIGLPIVISLSIGWLWFTRDRGPRIELTGIGLASVLVFSVVALLRWDGLDGRQRTELSWRWTPSAEERFLQQTSAPAAVTSTSSPPVLEETAEDWSSFRGATREGVVREVSLTDWSHGSPREVWRRRVGPGWSSVIAIGDFLFTQEQRADREAVVCYLAASGEEVWVHTAKDVGDRFDDSLSGTGPRATPTYHDQRIYAYGAKGNLECLDATTGAPHWSHSLFKMTDAAVPQWGAATSPTIVDDKVVVFVGGKDGKSLLAFDRLSGELRWEAAGGTVSYSSPQVFTLDGERQIVMHDEAGLSGFRIEDGQRLWHHSSPHAASFQPMLQPHQISKDTLIVNWDAGLLCCQIQHAGETWTTKEVWTTNRLKPSFNDFVIHDGHIYGLDDGILCCVDLAKRQRTWKRGRYGYGQILLLPELNELLVLSEQGDIIRVALDPREHRELGTFTAIRGKTWGHPIIVRGRLIVRNSEEMACFELMSPPATARVD